MTLDILPLIGLGGLTDTICGILGWILNAFITFRREKREDRKLDREDTTGVLAAAREAVTLAREGQAAARKDLEAEQLEFATKLAALKAERDSEISQLQIRVATLYKEINTLQKENNELKGWKP